MKNSDPNNIHDSVASEDNKANIKRNQEIQDWLNLYIYHPLAYRLAQKLANTKISPNFLSLIGGMIVLLATYIYTLSYSPTFVIIALLLHMSWHIIDGADGDLARLTGKAGPLGEVVDGLSDYISHIILYCTLAVLLSDQIGPLWAWGLAVSAGISRIIQANHYEICRRQYEWWVYKKSWLGEISISTQDIWTHIASIFAKLYMSLGKKNNRSFSLIDEQVKKAKDPHYAAKQLEDAARDKFLPYLKSIHLLSANYRTIFLGISMLIGSPMWYFLIETIILNIVLICSLPHYNRFIKYLENLITNSN